MIYTFGCSATKWHWPTWADWLRVYSGPVTNLGYKAYSNDNIYWNLLDKLDTIAADDQVIIMWTQSHRLGAWYDFDWIKKHDVEGFFPKTDGKIWHTNNEPYRGFYRTHPNYYTSLTHMIVTELNTIYQTQLLLNNRGCDYTMMFTHNPFLDCRPKHEPDFELVWHKKTIITESEIEFAKQIFSLSPVGNLLRKINWQKFAEVPNDPFDPKSYFGILEYFRNKKEYLIYHHDTDPHPTALTQHDFALEKILKQNSKLGKFRSTAIEISQQAMLMHIPVFSDIDYVATPETKLLHPEFEKILNAL